MDDAGFAILQIVLNIVILVAGLVVFTGRVATKIAAIDAKFDLLVAKIESVREASSVEIKRLKDADEKASESRAKIWSRINDAEVRQGRQSERCRMLHKPD